LNQRCKVSGKWGDPDLQFDYTEAARWWRKAAEHGNSDAQAHLGHTCYHGQGVPKDLVEAADWFRKAAQRGDVRDADAQEKLGLAYCSGDGIEQAYAEAAGWFHKAADQGYASTQFNLSGMYYYGHGVRQD
jgi:TPR repeat protein